MYEDIQAALDALKRTHLNEQSLYEVRIESQATEIKQLQDTVVGLMHDLTTLRDGEGQYAEMKTELKVANDTIDALRRDHAATNSRLDYAREQIKGLEAKLVNRTVQFSAAANDRDRLQMVIDALHNTLREAAS